jgi:ribosomal protein L37AE/L43A
MRRVIEEGRILVIYPAGLMCEDGRSTPIPAATYEFLKWLKTDVYVARTSGTYFTMPKWTTGIRRGTTYMDIYKLFNKEDVINMEISEIKEKTNKALEFDAYKEQEILHIKYSHNDNIEGLENVLYMCPNCHSEFSIHVKDQNTLWCDKCGYAEQSDEYAFLHKISEVGKEIRYVSTWSKRIYNNLRRQISKKKITELASKVEIQMLPKDKSKFTTVGDGELRITEDKLYLTGTVLGEELSLALPTLNYASLPFKPGKYIEVQHGDDIFRCLPEDGRIVMKMINMIKIFYELNTAKRALNQLTGKKSKASREKKANTTK